MPNFDFWHESGSAMCAFQAYANNDDWFGTLSAFAEVVGRQLDRAGGGDRDHTCADVGSGFCHSLRDVIGLVHYHRRLASRWHAYEPDAEVAGAVRSKTLPPAGAGPSLPGLVTITDDFDDLVRRCGGRCGVVTLMHSIYYCPDAPALVGRCLRELVCPGGAVVILQLAEDSPFYLLDELKPRNGAYAVAAAFPGAAVVERPMRFRILPAVARDPDFLRAMLALTLRGNRPAPSFARFADRFDRVFGGGRTVDLRDQIVTIPKDAQ